MRHSTRSKARDPGKGLQGESSGVGAPANVQLQQIVEDAAAELGRQQAGGEQVPYSASDSDSGDGERSEEHGGLEKEALEEDDVLMADKVFDDLPESAPAPPVVKLGAAPSGRVLDKDVGSVPKAPWVNLFKDNRNLGRGIKLDEVNVEGDLVTLEEEDVDVVEESLGYCLVGHFAGKFPGLAAIRSIRDGWKVKCTYWPHRTGWIVFKFHSEEDRLEVLNGGPYFAYGLSLIHI